MAWEIERKFLPANDGWRGLAQGFPLCQGYLGTERGCAVRVRIAGHKACIGIKGGGGGAARLEFEYPVPLADARVMLERLARRPLIEKTRYAIPFGGRIWEVDEFAGENQGLIIIEVELESEDQTFARPDWVGPEVTGDPRYYNSSLVASPFTSWPQ